MIEGFPLGYGFNQRFEFFDLFESFERFEFSKLYTF